PFLLVFVLRFRRLPFAERVGLAAGRIRGVRAAAGTCQDRRQDGKGPRVTQPASKNAKGQPVAVVIGATSKWQADWRDARPAHGKPPAASPCRGGAGGGVGGAFAKKFPKEVFFTVLTTRTAANAAALEAAIKSQGGGCMIVELDLASDKSIGAAFAAIR